MGLGHVEFVRRWYEDFTQTEDCEVVHLLNEAGKWEAREE